MFWTCLTNFLIPSSLIFLIWAAMAHHFFVNPPMCVNSRSLIWSCILCFNSHLVAGTLKVWQSRWFASQASSLSPSCLSALPLPVLPSPPLNQPSGSTGPFSSPSSTGWSNPLSISYPLRDRVKFFFKWSAVKETKREKEVSCLLPFFKPLFPYPETLWTMKRGVPPRNPEVLWRNIILSQWNSEKFQLWARSQFFLMMKMKLLRLLKHLNRAYKTTRREFQPNNNVKGINSLSLESWNKSVEGCGVILPVADIDIPPA